MVMIARKCGLYIRVSTLRQADVMEGSLDAQEAKIKSYVDYENSHAEIPWQIIGIYREEGRSGKDLKRPQFQRMMKDIEKNKINTVIIWKIDRLSRTLKDFSMLWDKFQEEGVQLISLNEKFDTNTALGRAMLNIVLVFAQLEREQTGERTAATMLHRAECGLWNGGRVLGYDLDPEEKGILKVNYEQSEMVKKAFSLCIEKGSAGQVQRVLNELGYRMPIYESRRGKKHGGTLFNKQSVIRMLMNSVYIGKLSWAGKLFDGKHQPIIKKEIFSKVQKILEKNRQTRSNEKLPRQHVYLLAGILRCGRCDSMMTPKSGINASGKAYHYYQCTKNAHVGNQACKARYVAAKPIEDLIVQRVRELSVDKNEIDKMIDKANKKGNQKVQALNKDKKALSRQLQTIKKKLEKIVDLIENGNLNAFKSLNDRIISLEQERDGLEREINKIDFEISTIEQDKISTEVMSQAFSAFYDIIDKANPQKLKELLFKIVEVVEWHEIEDDRASGHCKISYFEQPNFKFPINKQSEQDNGHLFAQSDIWLPSTDSNRGPDG